MTQLIADLIAYLRRRFGREETVDTILQPITKITRKLEAHEQLQKDRARAESEAAERAKAQALQAEVAARRAAQKRAKIIDTFA